jgi:hypothetical protein
MVASLKMAARREIVVIDSGCLAKEMANQRSINNRRNENVSEKLHQL